MATKNYQHQCKNKVSGGFGSAIFGFGYNKAIKLTIDWLEQQNELVGISFEKDFYERYKQFMKEQYDNYSHNNPRT